MRKRYMNNAKNRHFVGVEIRNCEGFQKNYFLETFFAKKLKSFAKYPIIIVRKIVSAMEGGVYCAYRGLYKDTTGIQYNSNK